MKHCTVPPRITLLSMLLVLLAACDRAPQPTGPELTPEPPTPLEPLQQPDPALEAATEQAWQLGTQWLGSSAEALGNFHQAVESFLASPATDTLDAAREHWRTAHRQWLGLSPLLVLSESHPGLFGTLRKARYNIDAHPLEPGYIDSLKAYPYSGIVNDITLELTASNLRRQHGLTDDSDVALGFYALEFLLWGEDGERPASDYLERSDTSAEEQEMGLTLIDLPNNRRRSLLLLLSHLIGDDLASLQQQWQDPYSTLAAPFYRLHVRSRLQLLQDASKHLLIDQLADNLTGYSRFAGEELQDLPFVLSALQGLWAEGEQPLIDWVGSESERTAWREQLQALLEKAASHTSEEASEEQLAELQAGLESLAEIFTNPTLEP